MFDRINVQITTQCFLQCHFCPSSALHVQHLTMSLDFFAHICNQARNQTRLLALHLLGDPLTLSNLTDYLDCANAHGLRVELTSAGVCLKHLPNLSHPALKQLNFSLTSFIGSPEKQAISLRDYLRPIIAICQQKPKDLFINLRFWDKENALLPELLAILGESFALTPCNKGNKERIRLDERVFLCLDSLFVWASMRNEPLQQSGSCYGLRTHIGILTDGRVVPCCLDYLGTLTLGNLHEYSLEHILQNPRAQAMRNGFLRGQLVEELCKRCGYIQRFSNMF